MKNLNITTLYGLSGKVLLALAGGIIGSIAFGPLCALAGTIIGLAAGHLIEKNLLTHA